MTYENGGESEEGGDRKMSSEWKRKGGRRIVLFGKEKVRKIWYIRK